MNYDSKAVAGYVARLRLAEKLVFVFPQWWFNVPAILKGFFDRVLVPGVARLSKLATLGAILLRTPQTPGAKFTNWRKE